MKCYDSCQACKDPDKGYWHVPIEPKSGDRLVCRTIFKDWAGNCGNPDICREHKCGEDFCNCPHLFELVFQKEEKND